MSAPAQVTIGSTHTHNNTEQAPASQKVTIGATNTQNSMYKDTNTIARRKMVERKAMMMDNDAVASPENLGLVCVSRHVEASISSLSGTTYNPPPNTPARKINVNGAQFRLKKQRRDLFD